ncbi:MAG: ribonuclease HII [Acidobacteria bacterium]|nr:ribonuclease HII [Acidobacteriota bacterium]
MSSSSGRSVVVVFNASSKSISELRDYFLGREKPVPDHVLDALKRDPRKGARRLAYMLRQKQTKNQKEDQRLEKLLCFETELHEKGFHLIAGVDEAGMAPLAGPVVAAAVILPPGYKLAGLDDSKKILNEEKRLRLALQIKSDAVCWAVGRAETEEIDRINIYHAGLLAMLRAVEGLRHPPDYVLVDARTIPRCPFPQKGIIHGDALSASIAAASILAKTTRDTHMAEMDRIYPGYGFASHKGYPTPDHLRILKQRGALPIHRKTFGPVREALSSHPAQIDLFR